MTRRTAVRLALAALLLGGLAALGAPDAWARVGGGESYSRGGGSSSGGSGGGDGGALLLELLYWLVWLCIRYPAIGIPLVLALVALGAFKFAFDAWSGSGTQRFATHAHPPPTARPSQAPAGLAAFQRVDPAFSEPVLLDFLLLVHRRAYEAVPQQAWDPLLPYLDETARAGVTASAGGATVTQVVIGAARITHLAVTGGEHRLTTEFTLTRRERGPDGREQRYLVHERWRWRRDAAARSPTPAAVEALGCPACGAPFEPTGQGACRQCGAAVTRGQAGWIAVEVTRTHRVPAQTPAVSRWDGSAEPSVHAPTRVAPDLPAALRALHGRHPDFEDRAFEQRAREVFLALQAAWSAGRWDDARPFVTDALFQTLRFQVEAYTEAGLRNAMDDAAVTRVQVVAVRVDGYYEAISLRIWASAKDHVVDRSGQVVGGDARQARAFSEVWTFLRAVGTGAASRDPRQCPSCAAPLDRINSAGICGYCDAKITTGRFDWVAARIEQVEAFTG
jgi:hypothetical protein